MTDFENVLSDNSAVSIANIGGKFFALGETPFMQELCIDTLETKERVRVALRLSLLRGFNWFSATLLQLVPSATLLQLLLCTVQFQLVLSTTLLCSVLSVGLF